MAGFERLTDRDDHGDAYISVDQYQRPGDFGIFLGGQENRQDMVISVTDEAEILIKALRCKNDGPFKCLSCNAKEFCEGKNVADVSNIAAGLIDLQQAEIASYRQVRKALSDAGYSDLDTVFKALAQVKQERDVAVSALGTICIDEGLCSGCKYDGVECDQDHCGKMGCWEWQGIDENRGKDDE